MLVSAMFDAFTNYSFPGERARAIEVFLDTKRLVQGRRFDYDFAKAICNSSMVIPILSYDALELLGNHNPEKVDNMLLEWVLGIECFQSNSSTLKGIFPLAIGSRKDAEENCIAANFRIAKAAEFLPKMIPAKTLLEAETHLKKYNLFSEDSTAKEKFHARTIYDIVDSMMKFLFFDISSLSPKFVVAESTTKAVDTLEKLCRDNPSTVSVMLPTGDASGSKPQNTHIEEARAETGKSGVNSTVNFEKAEENAWKIINNKMCYNIQEDSVVQELLNGLGLVESSLLTHLPDNASTR